MAKQFDPSISIPSENFTCRNYNGLYLLVAESSELEARGLLRESQIYPDAADTGIAIKSARTGRTEWFYRARERRNPDNELVAYVYRATSEAINRSPKLKSCEVHILND